VPNDADVWNCRAGALREHGRFVESIEAQPNFPEAALNLGNALLKLDRIEEALAAYRQSQLWRPNFAAALCGEALALRAPDRIDEAEGLRVGGTVG
jgi:tetratricopeptide (TPR) repeat protein